MARPPRGFDQVDRLDGPERAKHRLRVILETVAGQRTIAEACRELDCSEARFHVLRRQALAAALRGLQPRRAGRPPKPPPTTDRVEQLEREVHALRCDLLISGLREEIALTMPHVLRDGKKIGPRKPKRRTPRGKARGAHAQDR